MTTPASGYIKFSDLNTELGRTSTSYLTLGSTVVKGLNRSYANSNTYMLLSNSYSKTANTYTPFRSYPAAENQACNVFAVDNRYVLVSGGYPNGSYIKKYDVQANTYFGDWYTFPSGQTRAFAAGAISPDKTKIMWGPDGIGSGQAFMKLDLTSGTFTYAPVFTPLTTGSSYYACGFIDNDKILFSSTLGNTAIYSFTSNSWVSVAKPQTVLSSNVSFGFYAGAASLEDNNRVVLTDGYKNVSTFNYSSNTWTLGTSLEGLKNSQWSSLVKLSGNTVMLMGGGGGTHPQANFIYDVDNNTWTSGPNFPSTITASNGYGPYQQSVGSLPNGVVFYGPFYSGDTGYGKNLQHLFFPPYKSTNLPKA